VVTSTPGPTGVLCDLNAGPAQDRAATTVDLTAGTLAYDSLAMHITRTFPSAGQITVVCQKETSTSP
jgi:hypothetical protein